jgi:hypothetical protein
MSNSGPSENAFAVTTSDTVALTHGKCRALYIGVTGNITLATNDDDSDVVFTNVPVGVLPIGAKYVRATGTTATGIVALY